jgi:citrate lyase subunit beta / citryl-CoA lyase
MRRSKLITPVLRRDLLVKAAASAADVVHIELEDGVPPNLKTEARTQAVRAIRDIAWRGKEIWVRVNAPGGPYIADDIAGIVAAKPHALLIPKVAGVDDVRSAIEMIDAAEQLHHVEPGTVRVAVVIERIQALHEVESIAGCEPRVTALVLGTDDMSVEYGYRLDRTGPSWETLYLKSRTILAARLAGIDCIDAAHFYYRDVDGTRASADWSAKLGFTGKTCLSPRQIDAVNAAFAPTMEQLAWAEAVIAALAESEAGNRSVAVVDGMMVDAPHALQAQQILDRARETS